MERIGRSGGGPWSPHGRAVLPRGLQTKLVSWASRGATDVLIKLNLCNYSCQEVLLCPGELPLQCAIYGITGAHFAVVDDDVMDCVVAPVIRR